MARLIEVFKLISVHAMCITQYAFYVHCRLDIILYACVECIAFIRHLRVRYIRANIIQGTDSNER